MGLISVRTFFQRKHSNAESGFGGPRCASGGFQFVGEGFEDGERDILLTAKAKFDHAEEEDAPANKSDLGPWDGERWMSYAKQNVGGQMESMDVRRDS